MYNAHADTEFTSMLLTVSPEINFCAEKQLCEGVVIVTTALQEKDMKKALIIGLCVLTGLPTENILPLWVLPLQYLQKTCCRTEKDFCEEKVTFDKHFLLDCEFELPQFLYWHFEFSAGFEAINCFKR